ncbi:MAG TPA: helix-turn-helix domain-containing protein [Chloroflexota bacterium]|nr:helix-turn-helix domain-containing protein [Chloroflexota bacterium]
MEGDDRMTPAQAAEELGISERAVQHRLKVGLMRGDNYGGRIWLIPREEVERAKATGRMKPGPRKKPRAQE